MPVTLSASAMITEEIERAHQRAVGKWVGCDWATQFGKNRLNLCGLSASQALLLARATSGTEKEDWNSAVQWLTAVEQKAAEAELEAKQAVAKVRAGKLKEALAHADRACSIEWENHTNAIWQPLYDTIRAAVFAFADRDS